MKWIMKPGTKKQLAIDLNGKINSVPVEE